MGYHRLTLRNIYEAREAVAQFAIRTPLIYSPCLSTGCGAETFLKPENLQPTGSFKIRGAANKLAHIPEEERRRGLVTVSSGNHGRAVSFVAKRLGIPATVYLSENVPQNKVQAIRELGSRVVVRGSSYDATERWSYEAERRLGLTRVHPFDDPLVIAGQGTIGIEIIEDLSEVDAVVVPLSGGGLASGVALAVKSFDPAIRVIGVSMARGPVMYRSLQAGHPVEIEEEDTLADALAGGIGLDNQYTFGLVRELVDEVVLVSEEEIAQAMILSLTMHGQVLEGGGAVGIAALMHGRISGLGARVVVITSGANVDIAVLMTLLSHQTD
ncbi:MAG: threonine/serine dehydratase [Chloroflexi bacterium]|nr:threonine/serine dehydratase [Chloroflexota bacterium]